MPAPPVKPGLAAALAGQFESPLGALRLAFEHLQLIARALQTAHTGALRLEGLSQPRLPSHIDLMTGLQAGAHSTCFTRQTGSQLGRLRLLGDHFRMRRPQT